MHVPIGAINPDPSVLLLSSLWEVTAACAYSRGDEQRPKVEDGLFFHSHWNLINMLPLEHASARSHVVTQLKMRFKFGNHR